MVLEGYTNEKIADQFQTSESVISEVRLELTGLSPYEGRKGLNQVLMTSTIL